MTRQHSRSANIFPAQRVPAEELHPSLGIFTRDVMRGLDLARRIPTGIAHINDQTVGDEPNIPFGGMQASGNGACTARILG